MGNGHTSTSDRSRANRWSHGGTLRKTRAGRGARPLSTRTVHHIVFKVNRTALRHETLRSPKSFLLIHAIVRRYAKMFLVSVDQISIQGDHIHALIRSGRRSRYQHFFRVVAGQIAQQFEKEKRLIVRGREKKKVTGTPTGTRSGTRTDNPTGNPKETIRLRGKPGTGLWKHRPFSRVVFGAKAHSIVRNYIQLNEKEALGHIPYRKTRLRGLSAGEWAILWT